MRPRYIIPFLRSLTSWRNDRKLRTAGLWAMLIAGPLLAVATFAALGGLEALAGRRAIRAILLVDFVYALTVAAFVARRIAEMIAARRRQSAGSRLHLRLVRFFTAIALIPTVLVAIFATVTLNFGLEGWFSDRVRDVVSNSMAAAQAYEREHRVALQTDATALADFLNGQKERFPLMSGGQLRELLTTGQVQMQRALSKAYVINSDGDLRARGEGSYLFYYDPPKPEEIERARLGETVVIQDWENNEFRALQYLDQFSDHFLFVSREVDGEILSLLDETKETVTLYQQLENDRGRLLFEFALIYLGFALVVILAAVWMGMWFAERLARPVGRLASAAERVGSGDLSVQVREVDGDDEIALLGRTFNKMTRQVRGQRDALISAHKETERRRRLFDSVLSGVTAGVIGLDGVGHIELMNSAAAELLDLDPRDASMKNLTEILPEFAALLNQLDTRKTGIVRGEVKIHRSGQERDLMVRIAGRTSNNGDLEGYVVSFDDITDLVHAQRMAAWGDVARRIAHEVKNPLTPIQLSAERMRRKFGPMLGDQRESLEQYVDVIVRQTNDLRRIVDEFSKFARMPAPERKSLDLIRLIRDAVLLQETTHSDIKFVTSFPDHAVLAQLDGTMMSQAMTNLLKNAAEAIAGVAETGAETNGEIRVTLEVHPDLVTIDIQDNGTGLPEKPMRLFEPYVTHRKNGTGLGLPIVKKIIEEHGGTLKLRPAPEFSAGARRGAWARIELPQVRLPDENEADQKRETARRLRGIGK